MEINRIAVKVSAAAERKIRSGHPWIFENAIQKESRKAKTGDLAIIFDRRDNKLIAVGLYDTESVIRIKLLSHGEPLELNADWFQSKIEYAYALRNPLKKQYTTAFRILNGENDGFPGLIVDKYADYLVLKLYSLIWQNFLDHIIAALQETGNYKGILLRTSRQVQKQNAVHALEDGSVLFGEIPEEVEFVEYGLKFKTNLRKGHKTGHFLDQRHNRHKISKLSKDKTVLDVFSYTGGFSVHSVKGGAKKVSALDISKQALDLAEENVKLNFKEANFEKIAGDAFDTMRALRSSGQSFDLVILDPPAFAKRKEEIELALKKYKELMELGLDLVAKDGLLFFASCSSRISKDAFFDIHEQVLSHSSRSYILIESSLHDIDHPIRFPEAAYLKAATYKLD